MLKSAEEQYMEVFLSFLASWLSGHVLNIGISQVREKVNQALIQLQNDPRKAGWMEDNLNAEERGIVNALQVIQSKSWRRILSGKSTRPIAIVGEAPAGCCWTFHCRSNSAGP